MHLKAQPGLPDRCCLHQHSIATPTFRVCCACPGPGPGPGPKVCQFTELRPFLAFLSGATLLTRKSPTHRLEYTLHTRGHLLCIIVFI